MRDGFEGCFYSLTDSLACPDEERLFDWFKNPAIYYNQYDEDATNSTYDKVLRSRGKSCTGIFFWDIKDMTYGTYQRAKDAINYEAIPDYLKDGIKEQAKFIITASQAALSYTAGRLLVGEFGAKAAAQLVRAAPQAARVGAVTAEVALGSHALYTEYKAAASGQCDLGRSF